MKGHAQDIEAAIAAAGTGTAWVSHLAEINVVLTTIATIIAIASGGLVLYQRYKQWKGESNESRSSVQRGSSAPSDGEAEAVERDQ